MNNLTCARAYGPDLFATSNRAEASKDIQASDPKYLNDLELLAVTIISAAKSKGAGQINPCAADAISILINLATRMDDVGKHAQDLLVDLNLRADCASVTPDLQQAARDMCQIVKDFPQGYKAPPLSTVVALFGRQIAGAGDLAHFLNNHIARANDYPNASEQSDQPGIEIEGDWSPLENKHDVPAGQEAEIGSEIVTIRSSYQGINVLSDTVRLGIHSTGTQVGALKTQASEIALTSQKPAAFLLAELENEPGREWHAMIAEPIRNGSIRWHFLTPAVEDAVDADADAYGYSTYHVGHGGDLLLNLKLILKAINDNPADPRGISHVIEEQVAANNIAAAAVLMSNPAMANDYFRFLPPEVLAGGAGINPVHSPRPQSAAVRSPANGQSNALGRTPEQVAALAILINKGTQLELKFARTPSGGFEAKSVFRRIEEYREETRKHLFNPHGGNAQVAKNAALEAAPKHISPAGQFMHAIRNFGLPSGVMTNINDYVLFGSAAAKRSPAYAAVAIVRTNAAMLALQPANFLKTCGEEAYRSNTPEKVSESLRSAALQFIEQSIQARTDIKLAIEQLGAVSGLNVDVVAGMKQELEALEKACLDNAAYKDVVAFADEVSKHPDTALSYFRSLPMQAGA
ncbi:MAG: hypothetical protein H7332_00070 [Bdellovibrionales bacterium]|nr:hypothetical protein [Ramlibacter sp.]